MGKTETIRRFWQPAALILLAGYTASLHWRLAELADEAPHVDPLSGMTDAETEVSSAVIDLERKIAALSDDIDHLRAAIATTSDSPDLSAQVKDLEARSSAIDGRFTDICLRTGGKLCP